MTMSASSEPPRVLVGAPATAGGFRATAVVPAVAAAALLVAAPGSPAGAIPPFGIVTIDPAFQLDGAGTNVDSIAFWETDDPAETHLFVTGKSNDVVEVWKFPFVGNEQAPLSFPANVNGVAVDQDGDRLYVTDRVISVFSLPDLALVDEWGRGVLGIGENNLDILERDDDRTILYVSDDHNVHRFDADTGQYFGSFAPPVVSIETVLADDFHQVIHVPEEQGAAGNTGIYAFHPDGTPFEREGTNRYGDDGQFDADEEGALLFTFPACGIGDDGTGFIVVSDQRFDLTDFEVFDRVTWAHLGTLRLTGVSNTDGIASTQRPMPGFPMGMFAGIDNDTSTACVGWDAIFAAMGLDLPPEAARIAAPPAAAGGTAVFTVTFTEPVVGFDGPEDLAIAHHGTTHGSATITGSGGSYEVTVADIAGAGSLTLAIRTDSDVRDASGQRLAFSVTSAPVVVEEPSVYEAWTATHGLTPGVDDGFTDDPDGDGRGNGLEFATDGDPRDGSDERRMRASVETLEGARFLVLTLAVRAAAAFAPPAGNGHGLAASADGVDLRIAGSGTLALWDATVEEVVPARADGLPPTDAGWSYRTFRLAAPVDTAPTGFLRLSVAPTAEP